VTTAAQLAALFCTSCGIEGKPNLEVVCQQIGLRLKEVESNGFDGALVCSIGHQKGIIAIRRSIRENSRKRFTIAHEIGHFVIPYHRYLGNVCSPQVVDRFGDLLKIPEREANEFAAELLLPGSLLRARFELSSPALSQIGRVAQEFETSLTATTRRFLDLTDMPCFIVWSEENSIVWHQRNRSFPFHLSNQEHLTIHSKAGQLFAGKRIAPGPSAVPLSSWFQSEAETGHELIEDSILLPNYSAVLSLLILPRELVIAEE
jgi:Zn-dependent peptidase ImmA (M78 family)